MKALLEEIKRCKVCREHLPLGPNPVVRAGFNSKILVIGQAPGTKVHKSGIPWNDQSGIKLRTWLNVDESKFYDTSFFAIMPMGFCYPGKGKGGDLPPRPECAPLWHETLLKTMRELELILCIGWYAQKYYLKENCRENLTETVRNFTEYGPLFLPLPHPSPRNNIWIRRNQWFEKEVIPYLRQRVYSIIG
ncbi:MAG: uracil-DNA glycosylase family protein [Flavobacteriales bacterium]|nr:uracil-DNA glycosylase family protein [Flavobacteriales bacterium]